MTQREFLQLLDRCLSGNATESEMILLDQFYQSYQKGQILWDLEEKELVKLQMYQNIMSKINHGKLSVNKTGNKWIKWAAIFVLIALAGIFLRTWISQTNSPPMLTESTVPGQKKTITLSDGSVIHLNAGSEITYPEYFDKKRKIKLKGEAFFKVTHDKDHPFIVQAGSIQTKVLGTSFNVNSYDLKHIKVTVQSGSVAINKIVEDTANISVLHKGQQLQYYHRENEFLITHVNSDKYTSWIEGRLLFEEVSLNEVSDALEKWYGVEIIFENKDIMNCILTIELNNEPLARVLEALKIAGNISYRIENNTVYLDGGGCF